MQSRFHYTIKQKLQILEEEEKELDIQNSHPIKKHQAENWKTKKDEFQNLSPMKQSTKYTLHPGPNLKYADLYLFLYTKVKELRGERQAIND